MAVYHKLIQTTFQKEHFDERFDFDFRSIM